MYTLAIIRYRKPIEEVARHTDAHRAYLGGLKAKGLIVASGPLDPRTGGAILLRVPDDAVDATLDSIRDGDPYSKAGVAQDQLLPWNPVLGQEGLDKL